MEKSKIKERHLPSRSSSSDSGEELRWLQRLEAERLRLKEEKKKQKEQVKANETPAEKRARRLRKKQEKDCKYREKMGWDNTYQCYTNQDNPFGDSALTDTFVWIKKLVKEGMKTVSKDELRALSRQKQLENKIELEKVKQRRLELEAVRVAKSETDAVEPALHSRTWARREDAFQLHQARLRSQIRIRDGRAKPIDLLAKYVSSECVDALGMHEPYAYLHGLQSQELEDLLEDIKVYKELECDANQAYWEDVQSIVLHELDKLRRLDAPAAPRHAVHQAVADDVTQIFKGKTVAQLEALQKQMEHKMRGRRGGVDVAFWEALLSQLKAHISRARLRERHQRLLRRQLPPLQRERAGQRAAATQDAEEPRRSQSPEVERAAPVWPLVVEPGAEQHLELYRLGRYSPAPLGALPPGAPLTHAAHDEARLARLRSIAAGRQLLDQMEPAVGSVGDQLQLSAPRPRPDPCRPRKPRYYNRVHTGFEWNKYNQTHYDVDHPPPKTVQGYKFNIFYPDLIDKTAMPEFSLKAYPENPDLAVVHFHAGAPYEDIAFKIVNREWDYSHKRGFRCHFHNNIFQLWFHFKRYRYRR